MLWFCKGVPHYVFDKKAHLRLTSLVNGAKKLLKANKRVLTVIRVEKVLKNLKKKN